MLSNVTKSLKPEKSSQKPKPADQSPSAEISNQPEAEVINKEQDQIVELKNQIEALEKRLQEKDQAVLAEKEKMLRVLADSENFKKRKEQELEEFRKYANESLMKALLPVLDSFDYAVDHAKAVQPGDSDAKKETVIEGFVLIQKQLHSFLEKVGVAPIEALNTPFDPNFHQAVLQEEVASVEANMVVKEMQKGYKLSTRILRPSMVVVSK